MKFLSIILLVLLPLVTCSRQRIVIKGQLMCRDKPYTDAQVKVVSKKIGFDNTLGDVKVDNQGRFNIDGDADEIGSIDPQLKIYHHCADSAINPLKRRWVLDIPTEYIETPGNKNPKVLDIGTWNLVLKMNHEEDRNL